MEHPLFIYYHSDLQTSAEEIGTNSELIVHLTIIPPLFICFPFIIILYILKTSSFNSKLQVNVDCTFPNNIFVMCSKFIFKTSLSKSDDIFFKRDSPKPFKREDVNSCICFFSFSVLAISLKMNSSVLLKIPMISNVEVSIKLSILCHPIWESFTIP